MKIYIVADNGIQEVAETVATEAEGPASPSVEVRLNEMDAWRQRLIKNLHERFGEYFD